MDILKDTLKDIHKQIKVLFMQKKVIEIRLAILSYPKCNHQSCAHKITKFSKTGLYCTYHSDLYEHPTDEDFHYGDSIPDPKWLHGWYSMNTDEQQAYLDVELNEICVCRQLALQR
jgi:hypothetical protein